MGRVSMVAAALAAQGLETNRISQSSLVLLQPIAAGATSYEFPILENTGVVFPDEIRIALQDMFFITSISVCFQGLVNAGGAPAVQNRDYFTAPPVQASALAYPLYSLYRGRLTYKINEIVYLQNWDLQRHYNQAQTQILGVAGVNGIAHQWNERAGSVSSFFPVDPMVSINGNSKTSFTLNIPDGLLAPVVGIPFLGGDGAATTLNIDRIAIILRGYLAQNASPVNQ